MRDPRRLSALERTAIAIAAVAMLAFGGMVVVRSAFQQSRKTDLDPFVRAAWAVRTGQNPYTLRSERAYFYIYPPLLAILMTPLADPPSAETFDRIVSARRKAARETRLDDDFIQRDRAAIIAERDRLAALNLLAPADASRPGYLPFWLSASIWYLLSLFATLLSSHWIASALERTLPLSPSTWPRTSLAAPWALRIWPLVFCAPGLLFGLARGQSNAFVLLAIAAAIRLSVSNRRILAGVAISFAAAIKVFPALLGALPLWRRDLRTLSGCAIGAILWFALLPIIALGPEQAWQCTLQWLQSTALPGLGAAGQQADPILSSALLKFASPTNQSLLAVVYRLIAPLTAPGDPYSFAAPISLCFSAILLTLAFRAVGPSPRGTRPAASLVPAYALFATLMIIISPLCHFHYFAFALPLVAWLAALSIRRSPDASLPPRAIALGLAFAALHALAFVEVPFVDEPLRCGLPLWITLALFLYACARLRREPLASPLNASAPPRPAA